MASYRITYQIRRTDDEDEDPDGYEIGFGSSGGWGIMPYALFAIESDIDRRQWETTPGMPDPREAGKEDGDE